MRQEAQHRKSDAHSARTGYIIPQKSCYENTVYFERRQTYEKDAQYDSRCCFDDDARVCCGSCR